MPIRRLSAVALAGALLLAGCGDDDSSSDSGAGTGTGADATTTTAAASGSADGSAWDRAALERVAGTEVEGLTAGEPNVTDSQATVTHAGTVDGVEVEAVVTLTPCDPFLCRDLSADLTAEEVDNVKSVLSRIHLDNPDLVFEHGNVDVSGDTAFFTYARSFVDDDGSRAWVNTYRILRHDGTNAVAVQVTPPLGGFGGPETAEELEASLPRDVAERVALDVAGAYDAELG